MNQAELILKTAGISGESKKTVESILKTAADVIAAALFGGEEAVLPGLGKIEVKDKPARKGRNPKTGEEIDIPAHRSPHFKACKALKDAVNS